MEHYKELFFNKKKHSYDLYDISFTNEDEDVVKYDNSPAKGFKLIGNSLLDPVTGYIFHPENSWSIKEDLIKRNLLINGVCIEPIIFEYIKDGSFNAHIYNDIKDDLVDVSVQDKVSLSESKPGTILRNIDDESYYIYMGLVGQYYVSARGKGVVRKKHLVLRTDYVNQDDDETVLVVHHFAYVDYNKDKDKTYFKVKDTDPDKLKIKYYSFGSDAIPVGDYIKDDVFQVYAFQRDYPSLILSGTIRLLFAKNDISMTKNKVKLNYEYVGETGLDMIFSFDYSSFDSKMLKFFDAHFRQEVISTDNLSIDFERNNYAIDVDGFKFLLSTKRLYEIACYNSYFRTSSNMFRGYGMDTEMVLYEMNDASVANSRSQYDNIRNSYNVRQLPYIDVSKKVKLYKVEYVLNEKHHYNIFNPNDKDDYSVTNSDDIVVYDKDVFDAIKNDGKIIKKIFGG